MLQKVSMILAGFLVLFVIADTSMVMVREHLSGLGWFAIPTLGFLVFWNVQWIRRIKGIPMPLSDQQYLVTAAFKNIAMGSMILFFMLEAVYFKR